MFRFVRLRASYVIHWLAPDLDLTQPVKSKYVIFDKFHFVVQIKKAAFFPFQSAKEHELGGLHAMVCAALQKKFVQKQDGSGGVTLGEILTEHFQV